MDTGKHRRSIFPWVFACSLCVLLLGCSSGASSPAGPRDPVDRELTGLGPALQFQTANPGVDLYILDCNGDSRKDIVAPLLGTGLVMLTNGSLPGVPRFALQNPSTDPMQISAVDITDLNGDSLPELAVLYSRPNTEPRRVLRLSTLQLGTFQTFASIELDECGPVMLAPQNSDDSTKDILVPINAGATLSSYFVLDGPLRLHNTAALPVSSMTSQQIADYVAAAQPDLDHNGLFDVLLLDNGNNRIESHMHLAQPEGPSVIYDEVQQKYVPPPPGHFDPQYTTSYRPSEYARMRPGQQMQRLALADLNDDNYEDLAVLASVTSGDVLPGPFALPVVPASARPGYFVNIYQTVITGTPGFELEPRASRTAQGMLRATLYFPGAMTDIKFADIDRDGILDLVGCVDGTITPSGISYLYYFPGLGNFAFGAPHAFILPSPPLRLGVADFDGDGFADVATLLPLSNTVEVRLNSAGIGLINTGVQVNLITL